MKKTVKKIESILKNSDLCEFIAVTIPGTYGNYGNRTIDKKSWENMVLK